jgi:hypothetical protein
MMGPPTAWALAHAGSELLLTDLDPDSPLRDQGQIDRDKEFGSETAHQKETFALPAQAVVSTQRVDASDAAEVESAVAQADVVVMCAVVREHRELAFRVNTQGTFNAIRAAVRSPQPRSLPNALILPRHAQVRSAIGSTLKRFEFKRSGRKRSRPFYQLRAGGRCGGAWHDSGIHGCRHRDLGAVWHHTTVARRRCEREKTPEFRPFLLYEMSWFCQDKLRTDT